MLSKEAIIQIIYSTIKIESLADSVEDAAQKIMELAQQTNNKQSTPLPTTWNYCPKCGRDLGRGHESWCSGY